MAYDLNNIFAKILREEIPCKKVFENEFALAFHDIAPEAPVHVLVVPKIDCISFDDFAKTATPEFMQGFFASVQKVAEMLGLPENGYRIISNHGADASQSVAHFHVHIVGGKKLGRLLP
jgi:diadenosine tetraphosphate (Ap4A) HIT family hydrolase